MSEKIFANGVSIKEVKFGLNMSINVDKFIEFLKKHESEKGYVSLNINQRKEVGMYGETHTATLFVPVAKIQNPVNPETLTVEVKNDLKDNSTVDMDLPF